MVTLQTHGRPHKYDMDITPAALEARLQELTFFERSALEDSSRRALNSTKNCYVIFCRSSTIPAFRVSFTSLGLFLVQYCHKFGHTTRSIPTLLSHLRRANREEGHQWLDAVDEARLDDLVAGLKKFDRSAPRRKLPMTHKVLADLQAQVDMTDPRGYQHIVMAKVAREVMLRGMELIKLKVGDLVWSADRTEVTIIIHLSKANKHGPPEQVILRDHGPNSAAAYLRNYYFSTMGLATHPKSRPLWPIISQHREVTWNKGWSKAAFVSYARQLLVKAGYSPLLYSGHSFRSGGATDLWDSHRCRPLAIKLQGRWKSDAYRLYIRDNPSHTAEEVGAALAFFDQATRDEVAVPVYAKPI